jgi:deoxycytidylate deaminase
MFNINNSFIATGKIKKYFLYLRDYALSNIENDKILKVNSFYHACCLIDSHRILSSGFNTLGCRINKLNVSSIHAEHSALSKCKKIVFFNKNKRNKLDVFIIRVINNNGNYKLTYSKPCKNCLSLMKKYYVKRIFYTITENNNDIIYNMEKINDIFSEHLSYAQIKFNQNKDIQYKKKKSQLSNKSYAYYDGRGIIHNI